MVVTYSCSYFDIFDIKVLLNNAKLVLLLLLFLLLRCIFNKQYLISVIVIAYLVVNAL